MSRKAARELESTPAGKAIGNAIRLVKRTFAPSDPDAVDEVSAIDLLTAQHREVEALFKGIEKAASRAAQTKLFDQLAPQLVAHDAIERELFYPACERALGMTDLLGEALVEHGVVEFCLFEADQARKRQDFSFKCKVLSEMVMHHVKEEENEFFPEVESSIGKDELEALGSRMRARFETVKASDFRGPLHANLNQVLAGTIKPKPKAAEPKPKAAAKGTRSAAASSGKGSKTRKAGKTSAKASKARKPSKAPRKTAKGSKARKAS